MRGYQTKVFLFKLGLLRYKGGTMLLMKENIYVLTHTCIQTKLPVLSKIVFTQIKAQHKNDLGNDPVPSTI